MGSHHILAIIPKSYTVKVTVRGGEEFAAAHFTEGKTETLEADGGDRIRTPSLVIVGLKSHTMDIQSRNIFSSRL